MRYVRPYRKTFVIAAFLTVFLAGNALVQPVLMQLTLDKYILGGDYNGLWLQMTLYMLQL